jgi:hypothetical protein
MRMRCSHRPDADLVSRALGVLCAAPCRELGAFCGALQPYKLFKSIVDDRRRMTTWLPRHRVPCTFRALPDGKTAVAVAGDVFYADEALALLPSAPPSIVFFGHYTEDAAAGRRVPRVLVYDARDCDAGDEGAAARYGRLRDLAGFLPAPVCVVQWVGHLEAAEQVLASRHAYPHEIDELLCLTDDVYTAEIPMRVDTVNVGITIAPRVRELRAAIED